MKLTTEWQHYADQQESASVAHRVKLMSQQKNKIILWCGLKSDFAVYGNAGCSAKVECSSVRTKCYHACGEASRTCK
jgi:hypothetical protein